MTAFAAWSLQTYTKFLRVEKGVGINIYTCKNRKTLHRIKAFAA
jgi:hypothetical protein